ncbi:sterol delta 5,6-desaturase ERG3 [Ascodesmis nigricans]|uniref:Sterol delta 5,6-desaturase ERG3 n=1 Tax=Ascodesmis nigricans TaxID=341454 RepID=A0A4S2MTW8_9PEZI|nr:sterol delta 5,6-desaturase ERG3 [Ascodesmis nigricans]
MDIVLSVCDNLVLDKFWAATFPRHDILGAGNTTAPYFGAEPLPTDSVSQYFGIQTPPEAYLSSFARDDIVRQYFSLTLITWIFGVLLYFFFATLSYVFIFDKATFKHPKYLQNQIRLEIAQTMISLPGMALLTAPFFTAEVRGFGMLYEAVDTYPRWYLYFQFPLFLLFTDFGIYWIHRGLHHKLVYKNLHKPHHKWIMPTPYASHAFHAVDGWAQSIPYHVFPFVFPLHKFAYLALFTFINIWTIMIHDGEYVANSPLINGAACHTMHHLYFNYNYGQFTTLWDRLGGSYRKPNMELFYKETKVSEGEWKRQVEEMEEIVREVENGDDRVYAGGEEKGVKVTGVEKRGGVKRRA